MKQTIIYTLSAVTALTGLAVLSQFPSGVSRALTMKSNDDNEVSKPVTVRFLDDKGQAGPAVQVPSVVRSDEEWRLRLTPEQYKVTRSHGTEAAFCGVFHDNHKTGLYSCVGCGLPLFRSDGKLGGRILTFDRLA